MKPKRNHAARSCAHYTLAFCLHPADAVHNAALYVGGWGFHPHTGKPQTWLVPESKAYRFTLDEALWMLSQRPHYRMTERIDAPLLPARVVGVVEAIEQTIWQPEAKDKAA